MIKLCVPTIAWETARLFQANQDVRYYLNGIHLSDNKIESTNGHVMYRCEASEASMDCGFIDGLEKQYPDLIIQEEGAKPTKAVHKKSAWVVIEVDQESNSAVIRYIASNGSTLAMQSANIIDGKYPDSDKVFSKKETDKKTECEFEVGFNAEYLKKVTDAFSGRKMPTAIKTTVNNSHDCVFFETADKINHASIGKEMIAVMPARLED